MSEDNKLPSPSNPHIPQNLEESDFTERDKAQIKRFEEEGLPGLSSVDEQKVKRMFDLYLSGKGYPAISHTMRIKKELVLYLADKGSWYATKNEYLSELVANSKKILTQAKLMTEDTVLQYQAIVKNKVDKNLQKFHETGDEIYLEEVRKGIPTLVRALDYINQNLAEKRPASPPIGLNPGASGVTITRKGDNEIEVTPNDPKDKANEAILAKYAALKRVKK